MKRTTRSLPALWAGALLAGTLCALPAQAQTVRTELRSYDEVPTLSTPAMGTFRAHIDEKSQVIHYELSYSGLTGDVTQAHIHLGARGTNGGVMAFLCSASPFGSVPMCPPSGTVSGMIMAADVVGPGSQGVPAGAFDALTAAIRAGAAYVNVHSSAFPGGEVRGQLGEIP